MIRLQRESHSIHTDCLCSAQHRFSAYTFGSALRRSFDLRLCTLLVLYSLALHSASLPHTLSALLNIFSTSSHSTLHFGSPSTRFAFCKFYDQEFLDQLKNTLYIFCRHLQVFPQSKQSQISKDFKFKISHSFSMCHATIPPTIKLILLPHPPKILTSRSSSVN